MQPPHGLDHERADPPPHSRQADTTPRAVDWGPSKALVRHGEGCHCRASGVCAPQRHSPEYVPCRGSLSFLKHPRDTQILGPLSGAAWESMGHRGQAQLEEAVFKSQYGLASGKCWAWPRLCPLLVLCFVPPGILKCKE